MDFASQLGKNIKDLREQMNLSQSELAKGICSQACISKIEKGELSPTAEILYKIAKNLRVDINYLFDLAYTPKVEFINDVLVEIRKKTRNKEYKQVMEMIKSKMHNPLFQENIYNKQFFKWHEGICTFYLENNSEKAFQLLDKALSLTRTSEKYQWSEREIEILLSKGIILSEKEQYRKAIKIYQECLDHLNSLPKLNDFRVRIRVLYHLTKTLIEMKELDQALIHCDQGIQLCIDNETLHLFPELYFQKGRIYEKMDNSTLAIYNLETAKYIFRLMKHTEHISAVDKIIKTMK